MSKLKNPLLSIGATGTIGDALTFQKRGQTTIVREKPIPAYRRTLPQVYQRWLYEDYAYLWTQQTAVIKRQCAATGSRFHLTGFQYWMKLMLSTLPDIAGMWHLDERTGTLAKDFSKNGNDGIIYGATPVVGIIDYAQIFDGINDYVACPPIPLDWNASWTIEISAYLLSGCPTLAGLVSNRQPGYPNNWVTLGFSSPQIKAEFGNLPSVHSINSGYDPRDKGWTAYHLVKDGNILTLYIDNVSKGTFNATAYPLGYSTSQVYFGRWYAAAQIWKGVQDQVVIYNRALDTTERQRHSKRRYPP